MNEFKNKKDKLNYYENQLNEINDEIDDEIENLKHLLIHIEIDDINLLSYHYKFQHLLNNKNYIEKIIFDLKY